MHWLTSGFLIDCSTHYLQGEAKVAHKIHANRSYLYSNAGKVNKNISKSAHIQLLGQSSRSHGIVMSDIATPEFLSRIKALYPTNSPNSLRNPWFFVAAVVFSASNLPEAVPLVYQYALKSGLDSPVNDDATTLLLVRKVKDALFKSGLLSGYPKVCQHAFPRLG